MAKKITPPSAHFLDAFRIGEKQVGAGSPAFIIAEAGVNHNGDVRLAYRLIDAAKRAGADAVKFQAFRADRLVSTGTPKVAYQQSTTEASETHYDMIKKLEIDEEFQKKLFAHCRRRNIIFLSTPYDVPSARFLNRLGVKAFKIASADIADLPLHDYVASTGKPVIFAVGMATYGEIERALAVYRKRGSRAVAMLHCVSNYPASHPSLNLNVITTLRSAFPIPVGYSDHSLGNTAAVAAAVLGACVFEKHFTLDKTMQGPDHKASVEPEEFRSFAEAIRLTPVVLGSPVKAVQAEEASMRAISRKSLVASRAISKGSSITASMLTLKRPGSGIAYADIGFVVGRKAKRDIPPDTLIALRDLE